MIIITRAALQIFILLTMMVCMNDGHDDNADYDEVDDDDDDHDDDDDDDQDEYDDDDYDDVEHDDVNSDDVDDDGGDRDDSAHHGEDYVDDYDDTRVYNYAWSVQKQGTGCYCVCCDL